MKNKSKLRVYYWDNCRFILMMMVIFIHSSNAYGWTWWKSLTQPFYITYLMCAFTMISGFWYKQRSTKYILTHLFFPFLIFSSFNIFLRKVFAEDTPVGGGGDYYIGQIGYAMWYIWALFLYYMLFTVVAKRIRSGILLFIALIISVLAGVFEITNYIELKRVTYFFPFFILGFMLCKYGSAWLERQRKKPLVWLILLMTMSIVAVILQNNVFNIVKFAVGKAYIHGMSDVAYHLFTIMFSVVMAISFIIVVPDKKMLISVYGRRTLNAYLLHMSIIMPFGWYLSRNYATEWYGYVWNLFIIPSSCLVLFTIFVDRRMNIILSIPDILKEQNQNERLR